MSHPGTGRKPLAELEKGMDVQFQRLCFKYLTTRCLSHLLLITASVINNALHFENITSYIFMTGVYSGWVTSNIPSLTNWDTQVSQQVGTKLPKDAPAVIGLGRA